jgi:hypothetical protein
MKGSTFLSVSAQNTGNGGDKVGISTDGGDTWTAVNPQPPQMSDSSGGGAQCSVRNGLVVSLLQQDVKKGVLSALS